MSALRLGWFSFAIGWSLSLAHAEEPARIDHEQRLRQIVADGIGGSLVLASEPVPSAAWRTFLDHAQRDRSRLVVLRFDASDGAKEITRQLLDHWEQQAGRTLHILQVDSLEQANSSQSAEVLRDATAVWLAGSDVTRARAAVLGSKLQPQLANVVSRGGVLGAGGSLTALVGSLLNPDVKGLELLPDSLIALASMETGLRLHETLAQAPGTVGYEIGPDAALIVQRRGLRVAGEGSVRIQFPANSRQPAETRTLVGSRGIADLTALRRYALDRLLPLFPPETPQPPVVAKGTLVIVGGGGMPEGLVKRFVELAGGPEASIVVIPISTPEPLPERDRMVEAFQAAGAKEVVVLTGRTIEAVESDDSMAALRRATGIWFGGGRQWRFIDAYEASAAAPLMHDVLKRGGVIGGSSAGASIQGEYMARGNPLGSTEIMADGYERGLNFLPGVAIDQHFRQRKRFSDMTSLVNQYPQLLGIGIDETTALVVQGQSAEVVGRGEVHFYDRRKPVADGKPDYESIPSGQRYDLVTRQRVAASCDLDVLDVR